MPPLASVSASELCWHVSNRCANLSLCPHAHNWNCESERAVSQTVISGRTQIGLRALWVLALKGHPNRISVCFHSTIAGVWMQGSNGGEISASPRVQGQPARDKSCVLRYLVTTERCCGSGGAHAAWLSSYFQLPMPSLCAGSRQWCWM